MRASGLSQAARSSRSCAVSGNVALFAYRKGEVDLMFVGGKWYVAVVCDVADPEKIGGWVTDQFDRPADRFPGD